MLGWNPRDLGNNRLDLGNVDELRTIFRQLQALIGASLVDNVNRLVRHVAVIDIATG